MAYTFRKDEEEIIFKKRLLYDGHGSGEDKRLVNLIKNITRFCLASDTGDDVTKLYNSISKELSAGLNAADKHDKISQMYDRTYSNLEMAIEERTQCKEAIKSSLSKLELKLQYVEKLKSVDAYPDCQTTERAMQEIENRKLVLMDQIREQKASLDILFNACKSLQTILGSQM